MTESKTPPENLEENAKLSGNDEGKSGKHDESGPSADIAALIDAITTEGRAYRKEEQREDSGKKFREWITIILIALTLGAIILQVREMIKVYDPIRDQAKAALDQANAAKIQAEAAQQAATVARDNASTAQRAWVGPSDASVVGSVAINQPMNISVSVFNTGREPAKSFSRSIDILTATGDSIMLSTDMSDYVRKCFATVATPQAQVIYPSVGFGGGGFQFQQTIPSEKVDQSVIDGTTMIIMRGCLTYQTSGQTKHSSFCFFYKGGVTKPEHLNICNGGSDAE